MALGIEVSDEEIRRSTRRTKRSSARPPRLHLGQITVADLTRPSRLAELLRQGTDLAWLARQHSIDRFKDAGGDRGWMVPERGIDPLQDGCTTAAKGDVLGPFGARGNYFVIKVDAREDQGYYTVEQASGQIRSAIYLSKFEEPLGRILQTLREPLGDRDQRGCPRLAEDQRRGTTSRKASTTVRPPAHGEH